MNDPRRTTFMERSAKFYREFLYFYHTAFLYFYHRASMDFQLNLFNVYSIQIKTVCTVINYKLIVLQKIIEISYFENKKIVIHFKCYFKLLCCIHIIFLIPLSTYLKSSLWKQSLVSTATEGSLKKIKENIFLGFVCVHLFHLKELFHCIEPLHCWNIS
jgi:hypothetical protein